MKNNNTCPKCGSTRIVEIPSDAMGTRISTGTFSIAQASYFVCCQCGFTEEWITSTEDLTKLWDKHPN